MTIDQFIDKLATTPESWMLDAAFAFDCDPRIRCVNDGRLCCPITACGEARFPAMYLVDARKMGMSENDANLIAIAADGRHTHRLYQPEIRQRLLDATVGRNS